LILSEQLIAFCDKHCVNLACEEELAASASKLHGHNPGSVPSGFRGMFCVCHLEEGFQSIFRKEKRVTELANILETSPDAIANSGLYSVRNLAGCSNKQCSLHAHSICVAGNIFIFKHPQLVGLTCFEIAHHPIAEGLWKSNSNFFYDSWNARKTGKRQIVHSVRTNHPLYYYLRSKYGLDKKRKRISK
jgi:hypothetical protein